MMSYWKRVDERLIKPGEKWWDMVGGGWLRLQYLGSKHCWRTFPRQEAEMDGRRAEDQDVHIQHAFESLNDVGNWAPAGEGKIEP
jgi:hypothetical protein